MGVVFRKLIELQILITEGQRIILPFLHDIILNRIDLNSKNTYLLHSLFMIIKIKANGLARPGNPKLLLLPPNPAIKPANLLLHPIILNLPPKSHRPLVFQLLAAEPALSFIMMCTFLRRELLLAGFSLRYWEGPSKASVPSIARGFLGYVRGTFLRRVGRVLMGS